MIQMHNLRLFGLAEKEISQVLKIGGLDAGDYEIFEDALDCALSFSSASAYETAKKQLKENIYGDGINTLEQEVARLLDICNITLSVSESLTGGMICERLIGVSGISKHFREGVVAYANEAKESRLGVKRETLMNFGAVSAETAVEMAAGLLEEGADVAISTTGIAGPTGGSAAKPAGLVYFGFATKKQAFAKKQIFDGNRQEIRKKSTNYALFNLILLLTALK